MPTPLTVALELAATGLSCFRVAASKCPTTPHGLLDASTDPGVPRRLWALYPGPLVGVRTGTKGGGGRGNVSRTFIRSDELVDVASQTATERELPDA